RIEECRVDAVEIHVGDPGVRIEAALAAFDVLHRRFRHRAVAGADAAEDPEPLRAAVDLAFDQQALLAVGVDDHSRRPVAIGGIDVGVEEVDGFEHVSIGVDHVVRACHGRKYRPARTMPAGGPAMLSREENELITRVAPGTPMGDTMRRYWIP